VKHKLGGQNQWKKRGILDVHYSIDNKAIGVDMTNGQSDLKKADFEEACSKQEVYSVTIDDLDLLTSVPAVS